MSDIIKHSKKVLSATLAVSTIVWSVGLFALAPVAVEAAAGDLIKAAGSPAVYLVDTDGVTIHPFPHQNVYTSWGFPADFSTTFTTNLSGFTVGNDVEFRDGSLVRALETPAVYVKADGQLRPVVSAEVFEALGYNYDNITWLPQSFLDKYETGATVTSTTSHPNGTLVKYATSSTLYLLQNGQKRAFASGEVAGVNGYANIPVITLPSSETYPDGSQVVVKESSLTVPVGVGTAPSGTPVVVGSGLSVSKASDTPASATVVVDTTNDVGQLLVPVLKLNFAAGSDGAVMVKTVTLARQGISADSDIDGLYLYDGTSIAPTAQLTDSTAVSSGTTTFNNSKGLFTVPAGSTKTIMVRADLNYDAGAGKTVYFELASASDVVTDGASVSGSFPMAGNAMSTAGVTDIGELNFSGHNTPSGENTDIDPGDDQEVWKVTFDSLNQPLDLEHVRFTAVGSIETNDLENFKLYHTGNLIGEVASMNNNYEVDFDLTSSPLSFTKGQSKTLSLRADIIDGSTRDFYFSFQNDTDVIAKDTGYGVYIQPRADNGDTSWSIVKPTGDNDWNITQGALSVNKATESPTEDVPIDASAVVYGIWDFKASGEDIKIKNLDVFANTSGGGGIDNGKLQIMEEGSSEWIQIGTTKDLTEDLDVNFTFGSTFIVPSGTTTKVRVVADVKKADGTSHTGGGTITMRLGQGSSNAQRMDSLGTFNGPSADKDANQLTMTAASLTISKFSGFGDQTVVAATNNIRVGAFTLTAGASSGVNVSSITVALSAAEAASVSNMYLTNNATGAVVGTSKSNPGTSNIYSTNIDIAASDNYVVDVYADVDSGADAGPWIANIDASGSDDNGQTVDADAANIQTITVGTGSLSLTNGSHPDAVNIVAGSTGNSVAQFTFSAQNTSFTVSKLALKVENNFATNTAAVKVQYQTEAQYQAGSGNTTTASGIFTSDTGQALSTATFDGLAIHVPANGDASITVLLDTALLTSNGSSGGNGNIDLDWNDSFKATPAGGSAVTTVGSADVSGNTFYVRKTVPTFTQVAVTGSPTSNTALYKFNVVADAAGNIELKQMGFNFSTSGVDVTAIRLYDPAASTFLTDFTTNTVNNSGDVWVVIGRGSAGGAASDDDVVNVGTTAKELWLRGTVTGWGAADDTMTVSIKSDTSATALASSASLVGVSHSIVWSDRSASAHTTVTTDWTNGFLLKNVQDSQSF